MLKLRETDDKAAFHFGNCAANVALAFVERQKLASHRLMQLAKIRSADGVANGDHHIRASFDQHAFIDGEVNRSILFRLVSQDPGRKRRNAVKAVRQDSERSLASLSHDARHVRLLRENFEREQDFKIHGPSLARFSFLFSFLFLVLFSFLFLVLFSVLSLVPFSFLFSARISLLLSARFSALFSSRFLVSFSAPVFSPRQSPRSCRAHSPGNP